MTDGIRRASCRPIMIRSPRSRPPKSTPEQLYYTENCGGVTATLATALPACGQTLETAQHEGRPPFRILWIVEPQVRQTTEQGRNRHLRLDASQLRAETKVNAASKRQRADLGTGDIQFLRPVGIDGGIAVGGTQQAQHAFTFRDALAAEVVDVFQRHPAGQLHGGVVAQ